MIVRINALTGKVGTDTNFIAKLTHLDLAPKSVHTKTEFPPLYVLIKYNTLHMQRQLWDDLLVSHCCGRVNLANALKLFVVVGFLFAPTLGGLTCEEV